MRWPEKAGHGVGEPDEEPQRKEGVLVVRDPQASLGPTLMPLVS